MTLANCDGPAEHRDAPPPGDARSEEIVSNLLDAGYQRDDIEVAPGGEVVVQGDGVIGLETSRKLAGTDFRQYRTTSLVSPDVASIQMYVQPSLRTEDFLKGLLLARNRWNSLNLHFTFSYVKEIPSDLAFDTKLIKIVEMPSAVCCDKDSNDVTVLARTDFPTADGSPGAEMKVAPCALSKSAAILAHVIMHELGHAVGMRHTDYTTRGSCGGPDHDEGQGAAGAIHISGTSTADDYDKLSVMNACYGSPLAKWSDEDAFALGLLY